MTHENGKYGPCHTVYNPCKSLQSEREIEKKLFDLCKDSNSLLLQTLDPPSDYEDISEDIPGLQQVIRDANEKNISVTSHLQSVFDPETIMKIADMTKDQNTGTGICNEWKRHRHGRITASIFSKVLHFRGSKSHQNYIVREIMQLGSVCLFVAYSRLSNFSAILRLTISILACQNTLIEKDLFY